MNCEQMKIVRCRTGSSTNMWRLIVAARDLQRTNCLCSLQNATNNGHVGFDGCESRAVTIKSNLFIEACKLPRTNFVCSWNRRTFCEQVHPFHCSDRSAANRLRLLAAATVCFAAGFDFPGTCATKSLKGRKIREQIGTDRH
jgi:hypothetical protein